MERQGLEAALAQRENDILCGAGRRRCRTKEQRADQEYLAEMVQAVLVM